MASNSGRRLYGYFMTRYFQAHGEMYRGSLYRDAGTLKSLGEEVGDDEFERIIDYYIDSRTDHSIKWLSIHYDELMTEMDLADKDKVRREAIKERTRRRMEELGIPFGGDFMPAVKRPEPEPVPEPKDDERILVCSRCKKAWSQPKKPGPAPKKCPDCKGKK